MCVCDFYKIRRAKTFARNIPFSITRETFPIFQGFKDYLKYKEECRNMRHEVPSQLGGI